MCFVVRLTCFSPVSIVPFIYSKLWFAMSVFTEDAGRFLQAHETKAMKDAYTARRKPDKVSEEEFVRSEFFGLNQVMHLLNQPGCVGLRIHHAKRLEDKDGNPTDQGGQLKPRVLLTGVDAAGNDMPIRADGNGLKDGGGSNGGQALGDGPVCPRHCAS